MNRDRYGAAVHEAGHVVVARVCGVQTGAMIAGIGDDDAAGRAEIGDTSHLSVIDQIAICAAGMQAQRMLGAATHEVAGLSDEVRIYNILDDYEPTEGEALRDAGFGKSRETLEAYRATVELLAAALAEQGELDHAAVEHIIGDGLQRRSS